jgi:transposase
MVYNRYKKTWTDKMINIEIRKLIVAAHKNGMGLKEIMKTFQVKRTAVYNLFELEMETGSVEPRPHARGRKPALNTEKMKNLEKLIIAQPDITLQEIKENMDLKISIPAISKIIRNKLHYQYKKRRYMPVRETVQTCRKNENCGKNSNKK